MKNRINEIAEEVEMLVRREIRVSNENEVKWEMAYKDLYDTFEYQIGLTDREIYIHLKNGHKISKEISEGIKIGLKYAVDILKEHEPKLD